MRHVKYGPVHHDQEKKTQGRAPEHQPAHTPGATGVAAYVLNLQRTIGNQAVGQLLRQYIAPPSVRNAADHGERADRLPRALPSVRGMPARVQRKRSTGRPQLTASDMMVQRVDAAGLVTLTGLGLTTDALKIAAAVMTPGGQLTVGGKALAKHSVRPGSAFGPEVKGKVSVKNDGAAAIIAAILDGAGSTVTAKNAGRYGAVIDIFDPGVRGVRFLQTGGFIGFLEP
jgi:hypothetical protein